MLDLITVKRNILRVYTLKNISTTARITVSDITEGLDMTLKYNRTFRDFDFFEKLKDYFDEEIEGQLFLKYTFSQNNAITNFLKIDTNLIQDIKEIILDEIENNNTHLTNEELYYKTNTDFPIFIISVDGEKLYSNNILKIREITESDSNKLENIILNELGSTALNNLDWYNPESFKKLNLDGLEISVLSKDYYTNKNILRNYTDYDDYLKEGVNKILDDIVTKDLFKSFEKVKENFLLRVRYDFEEEKEYIKSVDLDHYEYDLNLDKDIAEKEIVEVKKNELEKRLKTEEKTKNSFEKE